MHEYSIRSVCLGDAEDATGILAIYAPFVRDTPVTFEYEVPSLDMFTQRIKSIASSYPYLVCERKGVIVAYAYASRHMERAAYGWDVQTSVYAAPEVIGSGIARSVYAALFDLLIVCGYCNAYAIITLPNPRSVRFHERAGFVPAGVHHNTGYKAGVWHDVIWMEKILAPHSVSPVLPRSVSALELSGKALPHRTPSAGGRDCA